MVLAILVFLVVSGAVLGAYVALLRLPGFMAGRQLEQRLKDLNDVDGESPGATTVVLSQAQASALPGMDRLIKSNAGSWLSTLIDQSGVAVGPGTVVMLSVLGGVGIGLITLLFAPIWVFAVMAGAFGLTLSALLARAERASGRLARRGDQPQWTDPATGYRRRVVSPSTGGPLEIVEVDLPAGATVEFPAAAYTFRYHQILVLSGTLTLIEGEAEHTLAKGDCLELGPPAATTYANRTARGCSYLVLLVRN